MTSKSNLYVVKTPVEETRWSKLQGCSEISDRGPDSNNYDLKNNTFKGGQQQENTYSRFKPFVETPSKPEKIFDMDAMTDETLNEEFPPMG
jgi:hypothetical protein